MTCNEFRALKGRTAEGVTRAFIADMVKHVVGCPSCRDFAKAHSEPIDGWDDAMSSELIREVADDPECGVYMLDPMAVTEGVQQGIVWLLPAVAALVSKNIMPIEEMDGILNAMKSRVTKPWESHPGDLAEKSTMRALLAESLRILLAELEKP